MAESLSESGTGMHHVPTAYGFTLCVYAGDITKAPAEGITVIERGHLEGTSNIIRLMKNQLPDFRSKRRELFEQNDGQLDVGKVYICPGSRQNPRIFHAVSSGEQNLDTATLYQKVVSFAEENGCKSVAVPFSAAGSGSDAVDMLCKGLEMYAEERYRRSRTSKLERVLIVLFDGKIKSSVISGLHASFATKSNTKRSGESKASNTPDRTDIRTGVGDMTADNENLKTDNRDMMTGNREIKTEGGDMKTEGGDMKTEGGNMKTNNGNLKTDTRDMMTEGRDMMTNKVVLKKGTRDTLTEGGDMKAEGGDMTTNNDNLKTDYRDMTTKKRDLNTEGWDMKTKGWDMKTKDGDMTTNSGNMETDNRDVMTDNIVMKAGIQEITRLSLQEGSLQESQLQLEVGDYNIQGKNDISANRIQNNDVEQPEEEKKPCIICLEEITDPKVLEKCGHVFCRECIETSFRLHQPVCPQCYTAYGVITGNMPKGEMQTYISEPPGVPGYEKYGVITINYHFPDGVQTSEHPKPGVQYRGTSRTAYLPYCDEGRTVLKLLNLAWKRRLLFTVGRSATTGRDNVVTWNDIHHKTCLSGGQINFGYPDDTYLSRVTEELASKGVTVADLQG